MTTADHTLRIERHLSASIEKVFAAFADVSKFAQWFGPNPDVNIEVFEYQFEKDGRYRIGFKGGSGTTDVVAGIYVLITAPTKIVFTWQWEPPHTYAEYDTLVTIDLAASGNETVLTLTHEQLPDADAKTNHNEGWSGAFDQLETWLATPCKVSGA